MNPTIRLKSTGQSWLPKQKTEPVIDKALADSLAASLQLAEGEGLQALFGSPAAQALVKALYATQDTACVRETLRQFILYTPLMLSEIQGALRVGPSAQALKSAARLRASLSVLHLDELQAIVRRLEEAVRTDRQKAAQEWLNRLTDGFHNLCPLLKRELAHLERKTA